ncbi:MAG: cytochrome C [Chitinophagia bacterium]|jgi:mono/diheme cytochrome c family protein|nr:cytochrome C [Chitinophagia bacterium]
MLRFKKIVFQSIALVAIVLFSNFSSSAQDGKAIFQANCASCHNPIKDATGPALQGVDKRVPSKEWIYNWVHNSAKVISSGDKYANDLYNKWNKTAMTAFPQLSNAEIDAVVKYVNDYKAPSSTPAAGASSQAAPEEDNSNMYILVTLALLVLMVILWKVNSGLKRVANEKQGLPNVKEIPFYRNKLFVAIAIILAFILAGYWIANGSIEMGRQQNYKPEQPIFYSHKVHAGINQINCLYCHAGAEKSKHAMVPSTNVCMNCHKQINEYTGEAEHPLYNEEGEKINGTEQIQLLYKYAGWDPVKKDYIRDEKGAIQATPIKWTKIHNLPDHVYFNHSQHVAVGKVPCQQCHGPIQEMDEVYQFSPLSMGWCINCHRQTKVQFENNNYYSIFEKYHQELKDKKRDGVTVEEIGGLECQRCHY